MYQDVAEGWALYSALAGVDFKSLCQGVGE